MRLYETLRNDNLALEERATAGDLIVKQIGAHGEMLPCPHGMMREDFEDQTFRLMKDVLDELKG